MLSLSRLIEIIRYPSSVLYPNTYSNKRLISYLRSKGAIIGANTRFISPRNCAIDPGRLDYIKIGDNCCLSVASIIAHDYSWYVFLEAFGDILPDSGGEIIIGNNCFIGYQALILKDTKIGDNVIIGARSVVKGDIPSNSVWAGVPARQICTLEELYNRKCKDRLKDAIARRDHIRKLKSRDPSIHEMGFFAFLFLERTEYNYDMYLKNIEFNGKKNNDHIRTVFFGTHPSISSYEQFLLL